MTPDYRNDADKRMDALEERIKRLENKDRRLGPNGHPPSPYDLGAVIRVGTKTKKAPR